MVSMVFRRRNNLRPINSVKHIVEGSTVLVASTNTNLISFVDGVDGYQLSDSNGVPVGSRVNSVFVSVFVISEGGEVAAEVPLVDWYIMRNPGNVYGTTFDATHLPTPGSTGVHQNKHFIIHTEKGLAGGGDASLAGVPMIFKGVIKIPKQWQRLASGDRWVLCARANFNSKVCFQFIYKHYS